MSEGADLIDEWMKDDTGHDEKFGPELDAIMLEARTGWQPIESAPIDGTEVITYVNVATVEIVRLARWEDWHTVDDEGNRFLLDESEANDEGWWSYRSSISQEMLEGCFAPTHWMPKPATEGLE